MKIAVTRITLNIHDDQMRQETLNWMKEEVWGLRYTEHTVKLTKLTDEI